MLVLGDYASWYPQATLLHNISAHSIAESPFFDSSLTKDTPFRSCTLHELHELLGIKSIFTSVYHLQTTGQDKWFDQMLKKIIRKFVHDDAQNWDKWLKPPL